MKRRSSLFTQLRTIIRAAMEAAERCNHWLYTERKALSPDELLFRNNSSLFPSQVEVSTRTRVRGVGEVKICVTLEAKDDPELMERLREDAIDDVISDVVNTYNDARSDK